MEATAKYDANKDKSIDISDITYFAKKNRNYSVATVLTVQVAQRGLMAPAMQVLNCYIFAWYSAVYATFSREYALMHRRIDTLKQMLLCNFIATE